MVILYVTEHEKSEADRDREEELLADILEMVTRRSNIVDRMDEDRLRYVQPLLARKFSNLVCIFIPSVQKHGSPNVSFLANKLKISILIVT